MSKRPLNAGAGRGAMPPAKQGAPYSSNDVDLLIDQRNWLGVEHYVKPYLKTIWDPVKVHPMLFLHIRRAWILDMISHGRVDLARSVFDDIRPRFEGILQAAAPPTFCVLSELADGLAFIQRCLDDETCHDHKYSADGMIKLVVTDYLMLHVPDQLGIKFGDWKRSDPSWRFATPVLQVAHPAFRCLVCSNAVFNSADVRIIIKHIQDDCGVPKTPFVMEKVASLSVDGETSRCKRARSSGAETDPMDKLATILDKMRGEVSKVETIAADVAEKSAQTCGALKNVKDLLTEAVAAARESAGRTSQIIQNAAEAAARESAADPAGAPPPAYPEISSQQEIPIEALDEEMKRQLTPGGTRSVFEAYLL